MKKCYAICVLMFVSAYTLLGQWPASGGPEDCNYGYTWRTNDDPKGPTFDWIDITTVGTQLVGVADDNVLGPVQLGFEFQYYWTKRTQLWIGSNGYLSFENGNIASGATGFPNTPSTAAPNDVIAPFMSDLSANGPGNPGKIYYYSDFDTKRFIVSYVNMPFWTDANASEYQGSNTFQVILDANDSTITFQYLKQEGSWDNGYDNVARPMVVGIENINAQCGLSVATRDKPLPNTAVRFYPPATPGLDVSDVAPVSVQNRDSKGTFIPFSSNPRASTALNAVIGNLGNVDINVPTTINAQVRDTSGQVFFQEQRQIAQMAVGTNQDLQFNFQFEPPAPGPYIFEVSVSNSADINATNNSMSVELVAVDTTNEEAVALSYASDNIGYLVNSTGAAASTLRVFSFDAADNGIGQLFEFYGFPIIVKALEYFLFIPQGANPASGYVAEMYAIDPSGQSVPGQLLFRKEVPADSVEVFAWNRVSVPISQGVIADSGFYVSFSTADSNVWLLGESAIPISGQSYEIIDGVWAQHRNNRVLDPWIRVIVDISNAFIPGAIKGIPELDAFEVYPNPAQDQVQLKLEFSRPMPVSIKLLDIQGRKHRLDTFPYLQSFEQTLDLSHLPPGVYFLQVLTPQGQKSKKIILR